MIKLKNKNSTINVSDKLLILLLALQAFGTIGGPFQPVRILAVLCIPFLLSFFQNNLKVRSHYRYEFIFFFLMIVYGLISLTWVNKLADSFKEVLYISINGIIVFAVVFLANKAKDPYNSIIKGWICFFMLTLPIALYEIWFDVHLSVSKLESDMQTNFGLEIIQRRSAAVTFFNLNSYTLVLIYTMPFLFSVFLKEGLKKAQLLWNVILSIFFIYIVLSNASRGALLCLFIQLVIFFFFMVKSKKRFFISTILFFLVLYFFLFMFGDTFSLLSNRLAVRGFEDASRSGLIQHSLDIFYDTNFLGVGAGNLQYHLSKVSNFLYAPHNLFLEIGVQYGLIIFLLFIGLLFRILRKQWQNKKNNVNQFIVISSLMIFPVSSVINSTYILGVNLWLLLASLLVISDKFYNRKNG